MVMASPKASTRHTTAEMNVPEDIPGGEGPTKQLGTRVGILNGENVFDAIATGAREAPAGEVIVTNSDWHEGQLAEQRLPYRDDLDKAAPEHPVVVVRGGRCPCSNGVRRRH